MVTQYFSIQIAGAVKKVRLEVDFLILTWQQFTPTAIAPMKRLLTLSQLGELLQNYPCRNRPTAEIKIGITTIPQT